MDQEKKKTEPTISSEIKAAKFIALLIAMGVVVTARMAYNYLKLAYQESRDKKN